MLTTQPIRTGSLYFFHVHDATNYPNYEWVQTDARLYNEGLRLAWRLPSGLTATVTLDMLDCEGE